MKRICGGLFLLLGRGSGCGGCGIVRGWIGFSLVLGSMLWSIVMYSSCSVHGGRSYSLN